ncbi:hypothetical protein LCGC14_0865670 [marine sediment metagenome]|uniref:Uncharacterized protein n=1 Tax=marine sediment metagenome TaxID=412755 RepID=A0A0F9PRN2_9ZZZZ
MTIQNVTPFVDYVGNGIVTSFSFNFRADDVTWINVSFTDNFDGISLNTDQDNNPGGSAEYSAAPPIGTAIRIERNTPITQLMDYTRYGPFDSMSHENNLDKLTMEMQEEINTRVQADQDIQAGILVFPISSNDISYDITAAEIDALVTPSAFRYAPYIGRRYSTKADWESITINLYVATTGSDSNDGETVGAPFATLQKALDTIAMFSNALPGKWQINCAAGTYSTAANSVSDWPLGLLTNKLVDIVGPDVSGHPNVPTAIFDGTNSSTTGFRCSTGAKVKLKDLKFQNYTTANAISGSGVCTLVLDNVHTDDADHGVIATTQCRLYVNGGLFNLVTPNTACIASEFFSVHHIGYSFNETTGTPTAGTDPTLTGDGTGIGMLVKEFASGHVGAVLNNFATGADISINSRIHFDSGTDIKNNGIGVKATHQSMFIDSGITWNTGGGDANTNNVMLRNFSSQANDGTAVTPRMTKKELLLSQHTGTTGETFLQSFTLRVGEWMGSRNSIYEGRILRVKMYGSTTGTAGTKTIRWRISTSATGVAGTVVGIAAIAASPAGNFVHEFELHVNGASAQRTQSSTIIDGGAILVGGSTPSVDMSVAAEQYINLTLQLANGADAVNINALSYEVIG